MTDAPYAILPSPGMALLLFALGAIAIIALKVVWSVSGLGKPTEHRVGEQMTHTRATVVEWSRRKEGGEGYVDADGERWRAISTDPLAEGDRVQITHVDGLKLEVKKA